jgi:hypothetical protein
MGDRRRSDEIARMGDETENGEDLNERFSTVGEIVEFWEGSGVRRDRTDAGAPAFVKRVEGKGMYAIKMLGSSRGKLRIGWWKSLFKHDSFNKNVARGHGARVRGEARMKERAKVEAEAKFGEELRETKRQLKRKEQETQEIAKQGEERLKGQDIEARKAEK